MNSRGKPKNCERDRFRPAVAFLWFGTLGLVAITGCGQIYLAPAGPLRTPIHFRETTPLISHAHTHHGGEWVEPFETYPNDHRMLALGECDCGAGGCRGCLLANRPFLGGARAERPGIPIPSFGLGNRFQSWMQSRKEAANAPPWPSFHPVPTGPVFYPSRCSIDLPGDEAEARENLASSQPTHLYGQFRSE